MDTLWFATSLVLYALGALLMHARLALLDDLRLSDLPAVTPTTAAPIAVPLTIAVVALWPIVVVLCAWLALVLLRPRFTRKPGRCPRPAAKVSSDRA